MAAPIGPGDFVECVNAEPHQYGHGSRLLLGAVYRVRNYRAVPPSVMLDEIVLPIGPFGVEASWGVARFKPIYRPKRDLITRLLQPVDDLVSA